MLNVFWTISTSWIQKTDCLLSTTFGSKVIAKNACTTNFKASLLLNGTSKSPDSFIFVFSSIWKFKNIWSDWYYWKLKFFYFRQKVWYIINFSKKNVFWAFYTHFLITFSDRHLILFLFVQFMRISSF